MNTDNFYLEQEVLSEFTAEIIADFTRYFRKNKINFIRRFNQKIDSLPSKMVKNLFFSIMISTKKSRSLSIIGFYSLFLYLFSFARALEFIQEFFLLLPLLLFFHLHESQISILLRLRFL